MTPSNLVASFTLYSDKITFSETSWSRINQLVPQAMMEWADTWQKLQELLLISGFIITDDEYEYESIPLSLTVDMLQFVCPIGKGVSLTNNLICGKLLNVKYKIFIKQQYNYTYLRTHCVTQVCIYHILYSYGTAHVQVYKLIRVARRASRNFVHNSRVGLVRHEEYTAHERLLMS